MAKGHSSGNGHQVKALLREAQSLQQRIDRAVALADQEIGASAFGQGASLLPIQRPMGVPTRPASEGARGMPSGMGDAGVTAPLRPAAAPVPGSVNTGILRSAQNDSALGAARGEMNATFGVSGTPITSGFLLDLGEYNPELMGRNAIPIYEKMRRSDAQVRATLVACKLPILAAKWEVMPDQSSGSEVRSPKSVGPRTPDLGRRAKEIAEFVKENLLGGLEFQGSTGGWVSQSWQSVIANALLMLDFGCAIHEDVWTIDGDQIKLRCLPSRLPLTFYRWHTEADGETLLALEQYGYRRQEFLNVLLPADKIARFTYQQEGANFWGIPLQRAMYPHWYIKSKLYRLDAIANERNSLGVPVFRLAPGFSAQDKEAAYSYVTQLASHEATGLVEPPSNGEQDAGFRIVGYEGRLRDVLPSIQHHNEMISRAALNTFMDLGQAAHGSRALGESATDFFMLGLQAVAEQIALDITHSTIRRLVALNFGDDAPCPRLVAGNVQARSIAAITQDLVNLAEFGLVVSENNIRKHIREKFALPEESAEGIVATKGETIDIGTLGASISGRSGGAVEDAAKKPAGSVGAGAATRQEQQAGGKPQQQPGGSAGGVNVQASEMGAGGRGLGAGQSPTPNPQSLDLAGHLKREDTTAAQVLRVLKSAKPALAHEAAQQAARLPLDQLQYVAVSFPHGLAQRVGAVLQRAHDYGAAQVWKERRQQTGRPATDRVAQTPRFSESAAFLTEPREMPQSLKSTDSALQLDDNERTKREIEAALEAARAKQGRRDAGATGGQDARAPGAQGDTSQEPPAAAERDNSVDTISNATVSDMVNWMGARAAGAAIEGLKDGLDPQQIEAKVESTLLAASDGPLSRTAQEAARQTVFVGRISAMKGLQDEIVDYERVEAMDDHTCDPCQEGSGTRWPTLDAVTWRAGDDCEGGDACRGRLFANFRTGMYVIENGVKRWINEQ